jgi:hypothetical protein
MVAAAHNPCQGGCILVINKGPQLSQPNDESTHEMWNEVVQCAIQIQLGMARPFILIATQSGVDDGPTMVAGTCLLVVPRR